MPRGHLRVEGLQELSRDLKRIGGPPLRRELLVGLKKGARPIVDRAKSNASSFSDRIPGSIRLNASSSRVQIVAGGARAPHAGVQEGTAEGGARRHPVFARGPKSGWTWRSQPPRQYLRRAVEAGLPQLTDAAGDAIEDLTRRHGFR